MSTLAVVFSLAFAGHSAPKVERPLCRSKACRERVARKQCSNRRPLRCIQRASLHWDVSFRMLRRKAWCESRFDPGATNGTHVGVFQFAWPTWGTTPYAGHSPWMAKWNALGAGWMHAVGRGGEWQCR